MKTPLPALLLLVIALSGQPLASPRAAASPVRGHCAPARITPIPGDPGAYRIETPHGTTIGRRPSGPAAGGSPASPAAIAQLAVFRVFPNSFDADGDTLGTVHDTIVVSPGTVVRWVRTGLGFHTVTNGADGGDIHAASEYNAIFDEATTTFDRTFTISGRHDFFCYIHEPTMEGSIIVTSATAGVTPGVLRQAAFTRPPAPNPTHGDVSFAVASPRTQAITLTVHDLVGRRVATIQSGVLPAGEHPFRWDGRDTDGRMLPSGRYFIRLAAGSVRESRAVSLVH